MGGIAPVIGAISSLAGAGGGGGSSGGGAAPAKPKPEPASPMKTADVLKDAKTSAEDLSGKKKSLSGLRIKRSPLGGGSGGSGLNL